MISRQYIMRAHLLLAGFILPIAILYFVSGALYTIDIKGSVKRQTFKLQLETPFTPNLDYLVQVTQQALKERQIEQPEGDPVLKKKRSGYELRWGDMTTVITLRPSNNVHTATLTVRQRSLLTQVMRIHRAEAGILFKVLAVVMVCGLIAMFATGVQMARHIPALRRPLVIAVTAGLLTFITLLLL